VSFKRSMTRSTRRLVSGTPLEGPSRAVWHGVTRRSRRRRAAVSAQNRRYDELTVAIMERVLSPTSSCIDAGAHEGQFLAHMVRLAPKGTHHAFEPIPALATKLAAAFPSVVVHQLALYDENGTASFRHVVDAPAYSGFERRPWDWYDEEGVEVLEMRTARLDDEVPPELRIDFMKIDVEGSEARLLRGAARTLNAYRPVLVVEVGLRPEEVFDELAVVGLSTSRLEDWLAGRPALTRPEYLAALAEHWYFVGHPPGD
jgi:FkbM family methyltransferase